MSSSNTSSSLGFTFGEQLKFCEPTWLQGRPSPYYNQSHLDYVKKVRSFVEREIKPNVNNWVDNNALYPLELHRKAFEEGISQIIFPNDYGGTANEHDYFHEIILWQELARVGGGGVLGQLSINSMAIPPILKYGSQRIKDKVVRPVVEGKKQISLMISEPSHGSDVSGITTTAERKGDKYIVNGLKKWITGGLIADFFTCLVRTGGSGAGGLSILLLERSMPGISVRKMPTQFDNTHNTTFVTLEDVEVPVENLIGEEGKGAAIIMRNFNHERLVIAAQTVGAARTSYQEAVKEAMSRKTFGKRLIEHQVIRFKLAEMVRQIEALQANVESVTYSFKQGVPDSDLGAECSLLKVQASKTFEYCAREAVQIFGGSGIVKEGRGRIVERLYREVRAVAIPGGSEEIMLDLAMREVVRKHAKSTAKAKM